MNVAVYLLRCFQMGIQLCELEELEEGTVMDMITESSNDSYDYPEIANQEDFRNF